MRRRDFITALLGAKLLQLDAPPPLRAAELQPKQLAVMLLRILAYDRNIKARSNGKAAPILVLYLEGNQASEAQQSDVSNALEDLSNSVAVVGLQPSVSSLSYRSAGELDAKLASLRPVALFACTGVGDSVPSIAALTRKRQVLSMTMTSTYLKAGLSIGLTRGDDRVNILINLPAARAEGADLDAALLRLAEIYR